MANENNLETLNLLWLDASLNDDEDSRAAQKEFRQLVQQFRPFTNEKDFETFLDRTTKDDRIALIVSGAMGLAQIPKIHPLRQIFAVYIYCMNKKKYEEFSRPFPKVKRGEEEQEQFDLLCLGLGHSHGFRRVDRTNSGRFEETQRK